MKHHSVVKKQSKTKNPNRQSLITISTTVLWQFMPTVQNNLKDKALV